MGGKSIARQTREAELDEAARVSGMATEGKYHAGFDRRAHDYALLGATDEEIAGFLEVSPASVSRWMVEQPSFRKAVKKARVDSLVRVVKSQHRAAVGYKHKETKVFQHEGKLQTIDVVKHYPPSTQAANLILMNRDAAHWKDTKTVNHTGRVDLAALVQGSMGDQAKVIEGSAGIVRDRPTDEPSDDE